MLRIILTVVLTITLMGCDDGGGTEPGDPSAAPSSDAPVAAGSTGEESTPEEPSPSASSTFGSSVTTDKADVQSDLEVRVAETISDFDGTQVEDGTLLTLPAEVLFDVDKSELRPSAVDTLDRILEAVQFYDQFPLRVTGHTDSDGTDQYNRDLSERRANAVADYLVDNGVDAGRIEASGRGETEPVASNDTAEGKQANRRVELLLVGAEDLEQ